jgi:hypothetical protein
MHCKCCDTLLTKEEVTMIMFEDQDAGIVYYEDLCCSCRSASFVEYDYVNDKQYQFSEFEFLLAS